MTTGIFMDRLQVGQRATVLSVAGDAEMKKRMEDLGLIAGTQVACVMVSPLGDPVAYRIRGAVIAIRRRDAAAVRVLSEAGI